jgi:quercetin dioxygenase-like cupin family protein
LSVQLWDVLAADATGRTDPRVLFSTPEARMVMIDLAAGERLGEHEVHERAISQVARGSIELTSGSMAMTCAEGAVILLEPGERHSVRAPEHARILLTLAPWPGSGHYDPSEAQAQDPHRLRPGVSVPAQQ